MTKLGKRLRRLDSMVRPGYSHIWDCCCDHGYLGAALLARQAASHIHFADAAPELIAALEGKLRRYCADSASSWSTHCLDIGRLIIPSHTGRQLLIIAGVGGDLTAELVSALHQNSHATELDYLLCPIHHQSTLRKQLSKLGFTLLDEVLVEENRRIHEILLVSSSTETGRKISPVGDQIWLADTPEHFRIARQYLDQKLGHYERAHRGEASDARQILDDYRAVTL